MTVVIHEFEVIPEPAQGEQKGQGKTPQEAEQESSTLPPQEFERIVEHQATRLMRVCAY